jgi:hypothetical protein
MAALTLVRTHQIIERISELLTTSGLGDVYNFPYQKVGAASRAEAMAAVYLECASNYKDAKSAGIEGGEDFLSFIRAADNIGMKISMGKTKELFRGVPFGVLEEFKATETASSFFEYLKSINPDDDDYWILVYARVKQQLPHVEISLNLNSPNKKSWWQKLIG